MINVDGGLPHRMTYFMAQDKTGFIWVSTQGAINRYNGSSFKTYNSDFLDVNERRSIEIAIDHANRLWYNEYDALVPSSGVIDTDQDSVYEIAQVLNGAFAAKDVLHIGSVAPAYEEVFIATRFGDVYVYNGQLIKICAAAFPVIKHKQLHFYKNEAEGSYLAVHNKVVYSITNGIVTWPTGLNEAITAIRLNYPAYTARLSDPSIGFDKLPKAIQEAFVVLPYLPGSGVFKLNQNYVCYAVNGALTVANKQGNQLFKYGGFAPEGDIIDFIATVPLMGNQNVLWLPSQNGLVKLKEKKNPFEVLARGHSTRAIFRDKGFLWIGGTKTTKALADTIKTEVEFVGDDDYDAMSFYYDLNGHLWIGTNKNVIVEYLPDQGKYKYYWGSIAKNLSYHLPFQNPVTGNYFIGTDAGVFRFNKADNELTPFPLPTPSKSVIIQQVYQNAEGIWLVSSKGIFLIDAQKEVVAKYYTMANGLPTNTIRHMYEDAQGIFWLGTTDAGLVRWDRARNHFRQYTSEGELSNNKIYAIYEDDYQTLWLPSDYGLMAFDKQTATTKVYLPDDGIAHEEFNLYSHFQEADGTLYFGGLGGVTKFHPKNLRKDTAESFPLFVTQIRVLERDAENYSDRTSAFRAKQAIVLSPNDRMVDIGLTLLDYEKSSANQYAYKLGSEQQEWLYTRQNKLTIINPAYGQYNLTVKGRGASGQWSNNHLVIPMTVQRPFYQQLWFVLSVAFIGVCATVLVVRWRVQKLEKDRTRLEAEVQNRTQKITEQAEALKALDQAKTRFFANITHEFRTPLTLVAGPVEQMLQALPPPAKIRKNLAGVLKNTQQLMALINQLLDLTKLESHQMGVESAPRDVVLHTHDLVQQFKPVAESRQLQLKYSTEAGRWVVRIDIDKWDKIVQNLLSNAVKFTAQGGRISLELKQVEQHGGAAIQLTVQDTGVGISTDHLPHIFDRFYQADASTTRLQEGTGIGLALVKELVALQKGSVTVHSKLGEGSRFVVILPVLAGPVGDGNTPTQQHKTTPVPIPETLEAEEDEPELATTDPAAGTQNEKLELLIIEDNEQMREYIRSCIDTTRYAVTEAANGEEGLKKAVALVPDLIVSDVMMPVMDGFEVTKALRANLSTSHIPLVLLTAKASLASRLEGLKRGADAYLTKPFSPQELALRINKLIELRQLMQKRYESTAAKQGHAEAFDQEDTFVAELKAYVIEHMTAPELGVDSISNHFGISRTQLYRKLKALINKPIADYIKTIRLEEALQLIKAQKHTVAEVAYQTGFSTPSNFTRAFKKQYGKSPSEFKVAAG